MRLGVPWRVWPYSMPSLKKIAQYLPRVAGGGGSQGGVGNFGNLGNLFGGD